MQMSENPVDLFGQTGEKGGDQVFEVSETGTEGHNALSAKAKTNGNENAQSKKKSANQE